MSYDRYYSVGGFSSGTIGSQLKHFIADNQSDANNGLLKFVDRNVYETEREDQKREAMRKVELHIKSQRQTEYYLYYNCKCVISEQRRNQLGDALEIELVKNRVLPTILPEGFTSEHIPRTKGGVDFFIIENGTRRIALECKNWGIESPSDEQIKNEILERFKNCIEGQLKILIGHVNFTDEQESKFLVKNIIWYGGLSRQVLPEDDELEKQEFAEKLKSLIASTILSYTGKYREDCVSPMRVNLIGGDEVSFELDDAKHPFNLKNKEFIWFTFRENIISEFRKAGPRPLDLVLSIKGSRETGINVLLIPKQYEVFSSNVEFFLHETSYEPQLDVSDNENLWLNKFFKGVSWNTA